MNVDMRETKPLTVLLVQGPSPDAEETVSALVASGLRVVGPIDTPAGVHAALGQIAIERALIDTSLGTFICRRVARLLNERGVPYFVYTGPQAAGSDADVGKNEAALSASADSRG